MMDGTEAASPLSGRSARRQQLAEGLEQHLTPVMSALGVVFLLVVLAEPRARPGSALSVLLTVTGWLLWGVFAAEYVARLVIAPDRLRFLRRTWWQLLFLVLPFLRFLRLVRLLRLLRTGRVLSSAIRSTRSAGRVLSGRLGWLASLTAITILAASQLLYEFGEVSPYGQALYVTTLAVIAGETFGPRTGFGRLLEVTLVAFSVGVFATLAGSLGAYFLETRRPSAVSEQHPAAPPLSSTRQD
jgi:voltage-gated potassium channel